MNCNYETEALTKIGEWFVFLSDYELNKARKKKVEIDKLIVIDTVPKQIRSYYDLVNFKHQLLTEEITFRTSLKQPQTLQNDVAELTDCTLTYLYFFMQAIVSINEENYRNAMKYLQQAEREVSIVNQFEQAEFHFRKGYVHYRLSENSDALVHLHRSYQFVKSSEAHLKLKANLCILKAGIYSESGDYEYATVSSDLAIIHAVNEPLTKAMAYRSKANNEYRFGQYEAAAALYERSLTTTNQCQLSVGIKSSFNLALCWLKLGDYEKGKALLEEVERCLQHYPEGLTEYVARSRIARELYISHEPNIDRVASAINLLREKRLTFEMKEVIKELSDYYKERGEKNLEEDGLQFRTSHDQKSLSLEVKGI
ncbi:response regulator aspartate phosphatase [Geomicrobium sp. JCM 19038]|nr:response regulator aspartate phosphatase [Geomicrobium sp. JCM 19038]